MANLPNRLPGLNFDLGEDADMLRSTVEAFAAAEIAPRAAAIDRDNAFPMDLWPKMGALGVLGVTVPRNTAAPAWDIWSMSWRWRKSPAPRPRSGCPMARTPTCASTRFSVMAPRRRSGAICRG